MLFPAIQVRFYPGSLSREFALRFLVEGDLAISSHGGARSLLSRGPIFRLYITISSLVVNLSRHFLFGGKYANWHQDDARLREYRVETFCPRLYLLRSTPGFRKATMGRMAAPGAAAAQARLSQVNGDSRDVPPSTISALVKHQSRVQQPGLKGGGEASLVFELLEDIRQKPDEHIAEDLEENADLLRALPQMFLASPQVNDPFEAREKAVEPALACLEVLELAVSRTPKVLFYASNNGAGANTQLCLSLFPRLFAAIVDWDNESVRDGLTKVFTRCLQVLSNSFKVRKLLHKLRQFYEQCVEGIY